MNIRIGSSRGQRVAAALAGMAAVAVLAAACRGIPTPTVRTNSGQSASYRQELAFANCMRSHGVPNFPDPPPGATITVNAPGNGARGPLTGPKAQSYDACRQLLPRGIATTSPGHITGQQFDQVVKIAQCLRANGEPSFPDPTVVNGYAHIALPAGVIGSAQMQAALNVCRTLIPKGVTFP